MRTFKITVHDTPNTRYTISDERLNDNLRMVTQSTISAHTTGTIPHVDVEEIIPERTREEGK